MSPVPAGTATDAAAAGLRRPTRVRLLWLAIALVVLAGLIVASVAIGSRDVDWAGIVAAFGGADDGLDSAAVLTRVPRTVLAMAVGAALGLSGAVMQGVTRNPIADPGILGINQGASLAIVVGIATFGLTTVSQYVWIAIGGAAVSAVLVYTIGSLGRGGATPLKLALAGAATTAVFGSLITAVTLPRGDIYDLVRSWEIGGVGGARWDVLAQVGAFLVVGTLLSLGSARALNSLALGDDVAAGLGERVAVARASAALGAVLLCGAATAAAGPIAFVGLVVPHVVRLLVGVDHRWLLPFSAVVGAALLTASDVLGRVIARPAELDVGILTAIVGAPVFIWIVRRRKVRDL